MEEAILLGLQNIRNPVCDKIFQTVTYVGELAIGAIILCLILLLIKKTRWIGLSAAFSLGIETILVNGIIKNAVNRTRPYLVIEELACITKLPNDASFPSGHTGAIFAVAFVLLFTAPKKIGIPVLILACMVAFSRIYLGVHYPTDVIGALAVAFICALLGMFIVKIIRNKIINH